MGYQAFDFVYYNIAQHVYVRLKGNNAQFMSWESHGLLLISFLVGFCGPGSAFASLCVRQPVDVKTGPSPNFGLQFVRTRNPFYTIAEQTQCRGKIRGSFAVKVIISLYTYFKGVSYLEFQCLHSLRGFSKLENSIFFVYAPEIDLIHVLVFIVILAEERRAFGIWNRNWS